MTKKTTLTATQERGHVSRADRHAVGFRVVWDDGESYFASDVVNISESGVFVETTMNVPVGSEVSVIPLVDGIQLFEVRGKVVRARDISDELDMQPGFALAFSNLTGAQKEELRRVLANHKR